MLIFDFYPYTKKRFNSRGILLKRIHRLSSVGGKWKYSSKKFFDVANIEISNKKSLRSKKIY